jgi:hypothetical protein
VLKIRDLPEFTEKRDWAMDFKVVYFYNLEDMCFDNMPI